MKSILRFCLGLTIALEILVWFGTLVSLFDPKQKALFDQLLGLLVVFSLIIVIEIFLYRYIGSSWEKWVLSRKYS